MYSVGAASLRDRPSRARSRSFPANVPLCPTPRRRPFPSLAPCRPRGLGRRRRIRRRGGRGRPLVTPVLEEPSLDEVEPAPREELEAALAAEAAEAAEAAAEAAAEVQPPPPKQPPPPSPKLAPSPKSLPTSSKSRRTNLPPPTPPSIPPRIPSQRSPRPRWTRTLSSRATACPAPTSAQRRRGLVRGLPPFGVEATSATTSGAQAGASDEVVELTGTVRALKLRMSSLANLLDEAVSRRQALEAELAEERERTASALGTRRRIFSPLRRGGGCEERRRRDRRRTRARAQPRKRGGHRPSRRSRSYSGASER